MKRLVAIAAVTAALAVAGSASAESITVCKPDVAGIAKLVMQNGSCNLARGLLIVAETHNLHTGIFQFDGSQILVLKLKPNEFAVKLGNHLAGFVTA